MFFSGELARKIFCPHRDSNPQLNDCHIWMSLLETLFEVLKFKLKATFHLVVFLSATLCLSREREKIFGCCGNRTRVIKHHKPIKPPSTNFFKSQTVLIQLILPQARRSFFKMKNSNAPPLWGTLLRMEKEIKPSTWQESNPRRLCHEACGLPLRYNHCPPKPNFTLAARAASFDDDHLRQEKFLRWKGKKSAERI